MKKPKQSIPVVLFGWDLTVAPLEIPVSLVDYAMDKDGAYFTAPAAAEITKQVDLEGIDRRDLERWLASYGTKVKLPKGKAAAKNESDEEKTTRDAEIEKENRDYVRGIVVNFILREIVVDRNRVDRLNVELEGTDETLFPRFTYKYNTGEINTSGGKAEIVTPAPASEKKAAKVAPLFETVKVNPANIIRDKAAAKTEKAEKPKATTSAKVLPPVKKAEPPKVEKPKAAPTPTPTVKNTPINTAATPASGDEPNPDDFDLAVKF